ncbi:hypothetical protein PUN28_008701 [Cardiocondyla obscurior]|uniref:Uncharacterized protein n=1 Tax=Cardiocondyla obscurior TaxID=286306 RepID=A0AAW2G4X9_9HYME
MTKTIHCPTAAEALASHGRASASVRVEAAILSWALCCKRRKASQVMGQSLAYITNRVLTGCSETILSNHSLRLLCS